MLGGFVCRWRLCGVALYHYPTLIGVCADQGYRGTLKNTFEIFHNIKVDISLRIKNEFEIQPVRWVVERTFGWMTWSRRLSKDYEIKIFLPRKYLYHFQFTNPVA